MNYNETLKYMYEALPMFHRIGPAAYKANLNNTLAICALLNNPEKKFKSIHIAGTNGKGSTSHMLASVLQEAGYKVGLYTSPHLKDFRERIRINGKMISKKYVIDFVEKHKADFKKIQPSFFEMTVGLAFNYFAQKKVDVAVIETGLGGRLDSTNVITPDISIITNISYDHTSLLGNTLPQIAAEKAGIIKRKGLVVIGEAQKETKKTFYNKAKQQDAVLFYADQIIDLKVIKRTPGYLQFNLYQKMPGNKLLGRNVKCVLTGEYQYKNIKTVVAAVKLLNERKGYNISVKALEDGLKNVIKNTALMGRWQILNKKPLTIADTGHNEAGIKEVVKQIEITPYKKLHIVFGVVNDKDVSGILKLMPKNATYYFCKANLPRAMDEKELAQKALNAGLKGSVYASVKQAVSATQANAKQGDLIFIGGSTFVVAEAI